MVGAALLVHPPNGFYAADGALVEKRRARRRRAQATGDQARSAEAVPA